MVEIGDKLVGLPDESGKTIGSEATVPEIGNKVVILNSLGKQIGYSITSPIVGDKVFITPAIGGKQIALKAGAGGVETGLVLAGSWQYNISTICEIFRSIDFSATFTKVATLGTRGRINQFAFSGTIALAAIASGGIYGTAGCIARSIDSGLTWATVDYTSGHFIFVTDGASGVAFSESGTAIAVGTMHNTAVCAIYRSVDYGATWTTVLDNISATFGGEVCYFGNGVFVAGIGTSIYRSDDTGLTWSNVLTPGGGGYDSVESEFLYMGSWKALLIRRWVNNRPYTLYYDQMYKTNNNGLTWTLKSTGKAWRMGLTKAHDGKILLMYLHGNVYQSSDKGETWSLYVTSTYPYCNWLMEVQEGTLIMVQSMSFYYGMHRIVNRICEDIHNVILPDGVYKIIWRVQSP